MGIAEKHAYRFVYLKSEQWATVRLEALAREDGKCQICGHRSLSNDAHHIWYPQSIYQTTEAHLVILCRACHDFVHVMVPESKTTDEELGREQWLRLFYAIRSWREAKIQIFETGIEGGAGNLRRAYLELKTQTQEKLAITDVDVLRIIKKWMKAYQEKNQGVDNSSSPDV